MGVAHPPSSVARVPLFRLACRVLRSPGGGEVVEQLLDDGHYSHRYRVTGGPMPVTGFVDEIRVHARAQTTSEIVWKAEFQRWEIPAADAEGVVAGVFDGGLDNLASLKGDGASRLTGNAMWAPTAWRPTTASSWTGACSARVSQERITCLNLVRW
ncbi:SRPBCC family protein [Streptomyces platensis]|uniref:SRPBCC family protein n=1 Tax=Streptomyces platensis TaxID=58346 RepID=UPI00379425EF